MIYLIMQECGNLTISIPVTSFRDKGLADNICSNLNIQHEEDQESNVYHKVVGVELIDTQSTPPWDDKK